MTGPYLVVVVAKKLLVCRSEIITISYLHLASLLGRTV